MQTWQRIDIKCSESENIICAKYIVWGQSQNAVNHSTIESITSDVLNCNITHQLFNQNFFYTNATEQ